MFKPDILGQLVSTVSPTLSRVAYSGEAYGCLGQVIKLNAFSESESGETA